LCVAAGLTALDPRENDFDNMLRCVKELKEGKSVMKPIYNHVNGTLDADEKIEPTPIIIFEVYTTYTIYTYMYYLCIYSRNGFSS
jgi:uridine kinase